MTTPESKLAESSALVGDSRQFLRAVRSDEGREPARRRLVAIDETDPAAETYLTNGTVVEDGTAYVPRLLPWYRGDFGDGSGIRRLLREYDGVDPDAISRIRCREHDWSLALDAFREEDPR